MTLSLDTRVNLADDTKMPVVGLGVWRAASGKETQRAVATALDVGYRLIDTAKLYGNERDVGQAVRASKIPRDEIFITTKLWNTDHGYEAALRAFEQSRRELGVDSIDLYLIHWPVPGLRQESWKALLRLKEKGLARSIGVSNYTIRHLEELLSSSPIPPSVNQVEFHPFLYQADLLAFCQGHGIQLEAYSPLTRGHRLDHPVIKALAGEHRRTPAQILIRWGLGHGLVVIPKSVRPERIRENAQVFDFELSRADMARLDALDERSHLAWDPDDLP
ncbi:MAG TPA: aldo/keto reductase [Thermoplasmata archaeon]|nr:aldo/keto reductase [Thermoplasmata archaeon]